MSDVIDRPILAEEEAARSRLRIIDCDVHPSIHAHADIEQFMPKRWQEHLRTYGSHLRTPYIGTTPYPRSSPLIRRADMDRVIVLGYDESPSANAALADAKAVITEVKHGVVTLTGTIQPGADHEQDLMPLTVRLIWDIDGVVDVVNRLG